MVVEDNIKIVEINGLELASDALTRLRSAGPIERAALIESMGIYISRKLPRNVNK